MNSNIAFRLRLKPIATRLFIKSSVRQYSTPQAPLILSETIPSPHCGHIKILHLNRHDAKNAISRALLSQLKYELDSMKCKPTETRALIIASAVDGTFCAGADLKERRTFTFDDTRKFLTDLRATLVQIASLPIPTISAIDGYALGGGLELALSTTFRVISSTARVGLPETRLGIIPGAGGTFRLPALVGAQKARELILTGRRIYGDEAHQIGLADVLCEKQPVEESIRLASDILQGGPIAVVEALRAVNGWQTGGVTENEAYEIVLGTQDRVEALNAFKEKRPPTFKGQ
ncbi:ClpP/crotonase [Microthyrium microscopicum]|uniref:ClpP/crotonase n=1 Tax=Microthyrium microscopicum TaxID=703497 RepID=A0A6A6U5W9_9PEZI|nr:ClpP/crotonase [Microthyrium microscopicum]